MPLGAEIADTVHRNQLMQLLVTAAELGNQPRTISTLSFAPCGTGVHEYGRLQIRMNHRNGGLTSDFSTNLGGGARSVLDETDWVLPHDAGAWMQVGLEQSFNYDPTRGDLIIQIRVTNADFSGSMPEFHEHSRSCLAASNYTGAPPNLGVMRTTAPKFRLGDAVPLVSRIGEGCGVGPLRLDSVGVPQLGGTFSLQMTNANPNGSTNLAVIWIGFQLLDRSLANIGMPGCFLRTDPIVNAVVTVTGTTSQTTSFNFPNLPALAGVHGFAQGARIDSNANALGVALSDGLNLAFGL